jgi:acetyl esterase/lipase
MGRNRHLEGESMRQAKLWRVAALLSFVLATQALTAAEPIVVPLGKGGAPGAKMYRDRPERPVVGRNGEGWIEEVHNPSLTVYLAEEGKATGSAVIVAPGGGHRILAVEHEGHDVGRWLAERGIVAAVLKYRLYKQTGSPYRRGDAIADGERAVRVVRSHADEWQVQPDRIGFLGFSAGGDLTMAVGRESDAGDAAADDPIERASSRPDFQVPIYPGGVTDSTAQVTAETLPTLLICAVDDRDDISIGVTNLYLAMKKAGAPVELHIYGSGGHGFGLRPGGKAVNRWPQRVVEWMHDIGKLDRKATQNPAG